MSHRALYPRATPWRGPRSPASASDRGSRREERPNHSAFSPLKITSKRAAGFVLPSLFLRGRRGCSGRLIRRRRFLSAARLQRGGQKGEGRKGEGA